MLMKRLLLLLPLLLASPAMADLGPADALGPSDQLDDWYTKNQTNKFEAYCSKWKNKCTVEFIDDHLVINGEHRVHRSNMLHAWRNKLVKTFEGMREYVHVIYKRDDGTTTMAQFVFANNKALAEFYNRLQLFIHLG